MTSWIKVEDKLPEEGQRVIYYFKATGVSVGHYYRAESRDCFGSISGWLCDDVTHWMNLPEPPDS